MQRWQWPFSGLGDNYSPRALYFDVFRLSTKLKRQVKCPELIQEQQNDSLNKG